jgi:hypothetical protein
MYDYFVMRINTTDHADRQTNTEREKPERRMINNIPFLLYSKGENRDGKIVFTL